jgi:hypothetical protein
MVDIRNFFFFDSNRTLAVIFLVFVLMFCIVVFFSDLMMQNYIHKMAAGKIVY